MALSPEIANDETEEGEEEEEEDASDDDTTTTTTTTTRRAAFIKMGCQPQPLSSSYRAKRRANVARQDRKQIQLESNGENPLVYVAMRVPVK